jgi:DNA-binding IclR family transcriptional regulator
MAGLTSADKALHLLEVLSGEPGGMALRDLARQAGLPAATAHRLLLVLRRRGFVRQDREGGRYVLTLKLLDMSFRYLSGSELRLHAYPPLREYAARRPARAFVSLPAGEVTYVWGGQGDAPAMYTAYGKTMPGHCSLFFSEAQQRRLSCARLCSAADVPHSAEVVRRYGAGGDTGGYRLNCACAPVRDYRGQEVARVGVFTHGRGEGPLHDEHVPAAWDLARATSVRLGYLAADLGPAPSARPRDAQPQQ